MITPLIAHIEIKKQQDPGNQANHHQINQNHQINLKHGNKIKKNIKEEDEDEDEVTSTLPASQHNHHVLRTDDFEKGNQNNISHHYDEEAITEQSDEDDDCSKEESHDLVLQQASPLLFLRYMYLYVDPTTDQSSSNLSSLHNHEIDIMDEQMLPRHALSTLTCLPMDSVKTLSINYIPPESVIKAAFDRYGMSAAFFYVKVSLDTLNMPQGDFSSRLFLETPLTSLISCTTAIYSYGDKILETKQVKSLYRQCDGSSFVYRFDYLHDYWTAFLNGFMFLDDASEVGVAVESLTMIQTFHAVGEEASQLPLLSLAYDFHVGDGSVDLFLCRL